MYNPQSGIFLFTNLDTGQFGLLELESIYYIRYYAKKGMFAINEIENLCDQEISDVGDFCFYCHVYIDLLFDVCGLIVSRFNKRKYYNFNKAENQDEIKNKLLEIIDYNRQQFDFTEKRFPCLQKKEFRNFVEHIDERDALQIINREYSGTFNILYSKIDKVGRDELYKQRNCLNNTLDLDHREYRIIDMNGKEQIIDIEEINNELKEIFRISDSIWNHLTWKIDRE